MRWRVNGSNAGSGNAVLLDVEADNAVHAVAQAHDQDIVVSHVVAAGGERLRRVLPLLAGVAVLGLALGVAILANLWWGARGALAEAELDGQRIRSELQAARMDLARTEGRVSFLKGTVSQRDQQREAEIQDLHARVALAEAAKVSLDQTSKEAAGKLAQLAAQVDAARGVLAVAEERWKGERKTLEAALAGERDSHRKAAGEIAAVKAAALKESTRSAALEARVGMLAAQVKTAEARAADLKTQLEDASPGEGTRRYALAISYDDALAFAALELGKPTVQAGAGAVTVSVTQVEQANSFVMHTDKDRVFDAMLQACLASDAPKDVLAANQALVEKFTTRFAPRWKDHAAWLAKALKQVGPGSGRAENERLVLMAEAYRISLWCNRDGQYSLKVEPVGAE